MRQSLSDIYTRRLLQEGHGYPLWIPEPNVYLNDDYKEVGTCVVDMGVVTPDGQFDYLFNVCKPANHPVNLGKTLENFECVEIREDHDMCGTYDLHPPRSHVASASMKRRILGASAPAPDIG